MMTLIKSKHVSEEEHIEKFPGSFKVIVDSSIYSRESLLRACYWFTDRAYLLLTRHKTNFCVHFRSKSDECVEIISGEFVNALNESELRSVIASETGQLKQLIVAKAFSEANLLEDDLGDYRDPVATSQEVPL